MSFPLSIDRVAKSPGGALSSTESEKCHFHFPHKSMIHLTIIDLGALPGRIDGFGQPSIDRVAKSPGGALSSTESEKCHFHFPHKSCWDFCSTQREKRRFPVAHEPVTQVMVPDSGAFPRRSSTLIWSLPTGRVDDFYKVIILPARKAMPAEPIPAVPPWRGFSPC
jgi:hypothetical protein